MVAAGKMPFNLSQSLEVVGIEDAARAMLLAAEHGKPGERYIISDSYLSNREVNEIAARAVGVRAPRITIPESTDVGRRAHQRSRRPHRWART